LGLLLYGAAFAGIYWAITRRTRAHG
jgi:hypothetical protein